MRDLEGYLAGIATGLLIGWAAARLCTLYGWCG